MNRTVEIVCNISAERATSSCLRKTSPKSLAASRRRHRSSRFRRENVVRDFELIAEKTLIA